MASIANMIGGGDSSTSGKKLIPTLQQASTLVQQILKDVQSLDAALTSVAAKAGAVRSALGGAPSGTANYGLAAAGGSLYPQNFLPSVTFNGMTAPNGGAGGGSGGDGSGTSKFGWGRTIAAQATAGFFGQAGGQVAQATQDEVLFNRLRTATAGNFSQSQGVGSLANLYSSGNKAGFIGNQDLTDSVAAGFNAGANNVTSAGFAHALAAVSQSSNTTLSQTMRATLSAASNPMAVVRLQAMGVNVLDKNGNPNDPMTVSAQLQRASGANYGKGAAGKNRVAADFSMYGPMRQELQMMGISDDDINQVFRPMFEASQQSGQAIGTGGVTGWKKTMDSLGFGQDRFGTSARDRSSAQAGLYNAQFESMIKGAKAADGLAAKADEASHALKGLAEAAGYAKGLAGGLGTKQDGTGSPFGNTVNSLVHDYFDYKILKMLKGGGAAGAAETIGEGAVGTRAAGVLTKVGLGGAAEAIGLGTAGGLLSKFSLGSAVKAGAIGIGGQVVSSALNNTGHHTAGTLVGDAATGAAIGSFAGPLGAGVGAAGGLAVGLLGMGSKSVNPRYAHGVYGHSGGAGMGSTTGDAGSGGNRPVGISANALAQFAMKSVGIPYSWGGGGTAGPGRGTAQGANTVGFDCSSFTQYVFAHFGVMLPRTTFDQVKMGVAVSARQAMAGDLLFFDGPPTAPGHVGIYLGNGQMIEAPHTGANVRVRAVDPASAVAIKRVINAQGTVSGLDGGGNAAGAPANPYAAALGALTNSAISRAQERAGVTGSANPLASMMLGATATASRGTATATVGAAPSTVSGNVALARRMASQRGWTGREWDALYALWNQESHFNTTAGNIQRAYGIPQALPGSKMASAGGDWQTNPATQITWGLDYIGGRYDDPLGAVAHKHATDSNLGSHDANAQPGGWYDKGAWKVKGGPATVHDDEMILPKAFADQLRTVLTGGGPQGHRSGHGGGCHVELKVYPSAADETAAKHLATMVMDIIAEHDHFEKIGTGS